MIKKVLWLAISLLMIPGIAYAEDVDGLCARAKAAENAKKHCISYALYSKAVENVIIDSTCAKAAEVVLNKYTAKCSDKIIYADSAEDLCNEGVKNVMLKRNCVAYNIYKKVKEVGYPNDICKNNAEAMLKSFSGHCKNEMEFIVEQINAPENNEYNDHESGMNSDYDNTEMMCNLAVKTKIKKDFCGAYDLYREIKRRGYPNDICRRNGEATIEAYAESCFKDKLITDEEYLEADSLDADELCALAVRAKVNADYCMSYNLYKKILKKGKANEVCLRNAEATISTYENICVKVKDHKTGKLSKAENVENAEKLCSDAVRARIAKDNCEAYSIYKKVKKIGYPNEVCRINAERTLNEYASQCKGHKPSEPKKSKKEEVYLDLDEMCAEGIKAKIRKDNCLAVSIYEKIKKYGYPNSNCRRNGEATLNAYGSQCHGGGYIESNDNINKNSDVDVDELCTQAVKAKLAKDYCKAYRLYKRAKKYGYSTEICKMSGESVITAYAAQCD